MEGWYTHRLIKRSERILIIGFILPITFKFGAWDEGNVHGMARSCCSRKALQENWEISEGKCVPVRLSRQIIIQFGGMIQSLSYLIQNTNSIRIDRKLLSEYQLQNTQQEQKKNPYRMPDEKRPIRSPRSHHKLRRPTPKHPISKYSTLLTRKSSSRSKLHTPRTVTPPTTDGVSDLQARLIQMQQQQTTQYQHFTNIFEEVRGELKRRSQIEVNQSREFAQIREDILETKRQLTEVIGFLNKQSRRDREAASLERRFQKSRAKSNREDRNVLAQFVRDTEYYHQ